MLKLLKRSSLLLPASLLAALFSSPAAAQDSRGELLRRLNAERERNRAADLRLLRSLNEVAQRHAQEIARSGEVRLPRGSEREVDAWMRQAGYNAHRWVESATSSTDDFDRILREWQRRDRSTWRSAMDPEVRDVGIGVTRMRGVPLYVFLFAVPEAEHFARTTSGLRDVERIRAEMLAEVNAVRRKAGVPPVQLNRDLQEAAQAHAEDMLARGYFAHRSPSGTTVRERARKAGYDWRAIGENIAEGQRSVEEVMATWMTSPGHRKNILSPNFKELGIGLTAGRSKNGEYRVEWVQNFGAR